MSPSLIENTGGGPEGDLLDFPGFFEDPPVLLHFIRFSGSFTTGFPNLHKNEHENPALSNKWKVWKRTNEQRTDCRYVGSASQFQNTSFSQRFIRLYKVSAAARWRLTLKWGRAGPAFPRITFYLESLFLK